MERSSDSSVYNRITQTYYLYGNAIIKYCGLELTANEIHYNTETGDAEAFGVVDSLGNVKEYALFNDGNQELQYEYFRYNFKSKRGKVKQLVTLQGEGLIRGQQVKQVGDDLFFIKNTRYTTCNLDHPHYYFSFDKSKIKNKKFAAGKNLNLYIKDIPTPLYFPFAIFPLERGRRAGFTRPAPAYDRRRGFSLNNVGWYQPLSDNMDAMLTGDIYTTGSWNMDTSFRYRKKYKYNIGMNLAYSRLKGVAVSDALGVNLSNSYQLRFAFNQDPKVWPTANLNASISLGQRNFKEINVTNPDDRLNNIYTSSISFNKRFPSTPFSVSSNIRYNQNTQSERVSVSLPDLNIGMNTIRPFQMIKPNGRSELLNNINVSYRSTFKNSIETGDSVFFQNPLSTFNQANFGAQHSIPISTSFSVLKFFNLNTGVNLSEVWSGQNEYYSWDQTNKVVRVDTMNTFRRTGWYRLNAGLTTRIFGQRDIKKGRIEAIRHVMTPNFGVGYTPDFSNAQSNGQPIFYDVQIDTLGNTREYSIFRGSLYSGPPQISGGSINMSVGNNIEMKIKSKDDPNKLEKIKIFENLNFNTSYNLQADSLHFQPITIVGNTNLFKRISINVNATLDPYAIDKATGRKINTWYVKQNPNLLNFTTGQIRLSGSLNKKAKNETSQQMYNLVTNPLYPDEQLFADNFVNPYIDFSIPWDARLSYNLRYSKSYSPNKTNFSVTNNVTGNFNFSLTDEWRVNIGSGYDFRDREFNYTRVNITRDLHCWRMGFNWTPNGAFPNYMFTISPKSSLLQDLRLEKKRTVLDNFN